eukprot:scaffold1853_cov185-Amphora_coffeaeformis.AAC.5
MSTAHEAAAGMLILQKKQSFPKVDVNHNSNSSAMFLYGHANYATGRLRVFPRSKQAVRFQQVYSIKTRSVPWTVQRDQLFVNISLAGYDARKGEMFNNTRKVVWYRGRPRDQGFATFSHRRLEELCIPGTKTFVLLDAKSNEFVGERARHECVGMLAQRDTDLKSYEQSKMVDPPWRYREFIPYRRARLWCTELSREGLQSRRLQRETTGETVSVIDVRITKKDL